MVESPRFTTSIPKPIKEEQTKSETICPDGLASLPMTTFSLCSGLLFFNHVPYAEANFTVSIGVSPSLTLPPMVPLIPEIDFISVIIVIYWP